MGLIQSVGHLKSKVFLDFPKKREFCHKTITNCAPFAIPLRNLDSYGTCQAGLWQTMLLQLRLVESKGRHSGGLLSRKDPAVVPVMV